jgi:2,5-diketo-D-gluconate reductase A
MSTTPILRMNDGTDIPQFGFGVFQIDPAETAAAVSTALEIGYRLIDTAQGYRNEQGVGAALAASELSADEVFVTTKLTNSKHGHDKAIAAFEDR